MATNNQASTQPATLTSTRPDAARILKWNARLQAVRNEFYNLAKTTPGFHPTYITELLAKLDQGVQYSTSLAALSLDDAPDITRTPQSLRPAPTNLTVDTLDALKATITDIMACYSADPQTLDLYMDAEGDQVDGGLSLFQICLDSRNTVYIVDVLTLKKDTFSTTNSDDITPKQILEDSSILKAFYDISGDSHTLFESYGIHVAGIEDVQLFAIAAYGGIKKELGRPLDKCVQQNTKCDLSETERNQWIEIKAWGGNEFKKTEQSVLKIQSGEEIEVGWVPAFNERPIRADLLRYAVQDVTILPIIYRHAMAALREMRHGRGEEWKVRIAEETKNRIEGSQADDYEDQEKIKKESKEYGVTAWKGVK